MDSPLPSTPTLVTSGLSPSGRNSRTSERQSERDSDALFRPVSAPHSGRVSRGSDTGSDVPGQGVVVISSAASDSDRPSMYVHYLALYMVGHR